MHFSWRAQSSFLCPLHKNSPPAPFPYNLVTSFFVSSPIALLLLAKCFSASRASESPTVQDLNCKRDGIKIPTKLIPNDFCISGSVEPSVVMQKLNLLCQNAWSSISHCFANFVQYLIVRHCIYCGPRGKKLEERTPFRCHKIVAMIFFLYQHPMFSRCIEKFCKLVIVCQFL